MGLHPGIVVDVFLSPPSSEAVRAAVRDVYADGSIQREPSGREIVASHHSSGPSWFRGLGPVFLYGLGAVALTLLLLALVRWAQGRRRSAALPAPGPLAAAPAPFVAPLGAADALAAQGRFTEAVHVLLLDTLRTLAGRTGAVIPPALTSREILGKIPLEPPAREPLASLVLAVETSVFGGRPAERADFDACVDHVHRFAAVYQRAGA